RASSRRGIAVRRLKSQYVRPASGSSSRRSSPRWHWRQLILCPRKGLASDLVAVTGSWSIAGSPSASGAVTLPWHRAKENWGERVSKNRRSPTRTDGDAADRRRASLDAAPIVREDAVSSAAEVISSERKRFIGVPNCLPAAVRPVDVRSTGQ